MNKLVVILFTLLLQSVSAQVENDVSIFHRLLIVNSNDELMVVKIANTDFWVTPGLYQTENMTIRKGLDSIAATYGVEIERPKLNGVFLLKRDLNGKRSTSLRNVYRVKTKSVTPKTPNGIEEIRWLSTEEAMELITFPHINAMVDKIMNSPNEIWCGTLLQFKENEVWRAKILEEFYSL